MTRSNSRWRNRAMPIIARVIADNPNADQATLSRLISTAYPFGQRKYHPYKIWCDEVRRQLNGGKCVFIDPRDTRKLVFGDRNNPFSEQKESAMNG